jgi:hypothetical protein
MLLGLSLPWRILQQLFVSGQGASSMTCYGGSGPALLEKLGECLSYKRPGTLVRPP